MYFALFAAPEKMCCFSPSLAPHVLIGSTSSMATEVFFEFTRQIILNSSSEGWKERVWPCFLLSAVSRLLVVKIKCKYSNDFVFYVLTVLYLTALKSVRCGNV